MAFNLPHLLQINGGAKIRTDVNTLMTSYDAYKVLTSISKGEGLNVYNVDELLELLKTQVDDIVGGGEDGLSLPELAEAIATINSKVVKDIVKVTANYTSSTVVLPENFDTLVPDADAENLYPVYYEDNTPVLDGNGEQLTLNLKTQVFSGIPSVIDPSGKDPNNLTYVPITSDFSFKFFPVGSFTFIDLPANALLDNQELQGIAYTKALDKIVTDLAQDQELIDAIKALVGEKTVQEQITAITNALAERVKALEDDDTKVLKTSIATEIRAAEDAEDTKVASEKAVASAIHNITVDMANDLNDKVQEIADRTTALETIISTVTDEYIITEAAAKIEYPISQIPNSEKVKMMINGFVYHENQDFFTVDREAKKVTWIATLENGGFDIVPELTNKVIIEYHTGEVIASANTYLTLYAENIPASGTYKVGDRIINTKVVTGGNEGWICVEAGTPGVWLSYGVVDFENTVQFVDSQTTE